MSYGERAMAQRADEARKLRPLIIDRSIQVEVVPGPGPNPVRGEYCENFWLPIVGPSTLLLARHLVGSGSGEYEAADLAKAIGLGYQNGLHSPLNRAANRMTQFELAAWHEPASVLIVRTAIPNIAPHEGRRLPSRLQARLAAYRAVRGE